VCVETETETEAEGTSKENGQIRLPREVIGKGLLALFFSNLFLQSLGYTPQRAALELQSVFELPEPPSFGSSDCHCTLPKKTSEKDAHGTEKLLRTS